MPQDGDGQDPRLDSPTNQPTDTSVDTQPAQPVDTGVAVDPQPPSDTSHPSEGAAPKDDRPRDDAGRFAPKAAEPAAPDPVKDAIDRLAKKPDAAPKPAGTQAAAPAKDAPAPEAKPVDEALKSRTKDDLDAPPEERARWKRDTAERFDRVLTAARTSREALEQATPHIEAGKAYTEVLDKFELHDDIAFVPPDHFAGVVKAQAAINRSIIALQQGRQPAPADLETFTALASTVETIRSKLGVPSATPAAPAAIEPFAGELPQALKDMVEIYGVDEKRVRLLAAIEAKGTTPKPAAPAAAPAAPAQPAPAAPRPVGVDMDQLYGRKLTSELHTLGVQNPREHLRVLLAAPQTRQEVIRRFPGTPVAEVPAIFDSLDASTRYDILMAAHKALTATKSPARPQPPPPATPNRGVPTTASPRRGAPDVNGDPVASAIALLARE